MSKGELTRQMIIEKSAPLFNQMGFAACSMHDVMKATGLEKGGLYRHFPSKEQLAEEVFQHSMRCAIEARTEGVEEVAGAIEKLRYLIRRFIEVPSPVAGGCPLMNTAIEADDGNPAMRTLAGRGLKNWKMRLCRIVEAGIRNREISAATEPRRVANAIVATLEGSLMISRLEGTRTAMLDARVVLEMMLEAAEIS